MQITIKTMRLAGLTAAQIAAVVETQEAENQARIREDNRQRARAYRNRKREQNQRSHHAVTRDCVTPENPNEINGQQNWHDPCAFLDSESNNRVSKEESKKERGTPDQARCQIPEDWRPDAGGLVAADRAGVTPDRLEAEIERFRNYHLARGVTLVRWDKQWANWVTSPYQTDTRKFQTIMKGQIDGREQRLQDWNHSQRRHRAALDRLAAYARGGGEFDASVTELFPREARRPD